MAGRRLLPRSMSPLALLASEAGAAVAMPHPRGRRREAEIGIGPAFSGQLWVGRS